MRTTLASSDAEAICSSLQRDPLLPSELAQTLVQRFRASQDGRPLGQRNDAAVRTVLAPVPLSLPVAELAALARKRLPRRLEELGLDRMPSNWTIKRAVLRMVASKSAGMLTQPAAAAIPSVATRKEPVDGEERYPAI